MKYPVLLPNIFDYPFTYESNIKLKAGDYVKVPLGKKNIIGVIWDIFEEKNNKEFKLKSINEKIEIEPLSKNTINFLKWFSNYNIVPLGMCLKLHLINDENLKIKNDKDLLKYDISNEKKIYQLSEEQNNAYKELSKYDSSFRVHLLQGTTGSGKTIVYFKAIEKILNKKLMLIQKKKLIFFNKKFFSVLITSNKEMKKLNKIFLQIASLLLPLLIWTLVCQLKLVSEMFLPSPLAVFYSLLDMAESGILFEDIFASTGRVFAGFIIATIISVPLGILMGSFPSFCALCEPLIAMLRYMPAAAFSPLLIIYLGIEEAPKIALIFIGTVYFNVLMVMDSVKFVPKELIETTLTLGGNTKDLLIRVIARYSLPSIIDTLRINIATSWNLVIVAELIAAEVGLGKRIQLAQRFFRTDQIFAELIVLGLIGFALDMSFRFLLRRTCKWAV